MRCLSLRQMISTIRKRFLLSAGACAVLFAIGYLALVKTTSGQTLDNEGYSGRSVMARAVLDYDHHILGTVSVSALIIATIALLLLGAARRCLPGSIMVVVGFASAILGAEVLKHLLPWHALVPVDSLLPLDLQRETYPSGHATAGTSLVIALILVSPARLRPWLAIPAGFISASFATGVVFAGWHRPSDALGGIVWSGLCMSLATVAIITLAGRMIESVSHASRLLIAANLLAALLVGATAWFAASRAGDDYPDADAPFLILSLLIISGSFLVTAWFGWQLRAVDWHDAHKHPAIRKNRPTS
jgi:PAP2 superfamily